MKDFSKQGEQKVLYRDKKVILMVRDPADVAVSQYFQWKFRMTNRKKKINNYPEDVDDVSLYDFVMMPACGLPKIIDFMNGWARELGNIKDLMVIRYEDLRADPQDMLRRVLDFIGTPATSEELRQAVEFASIENMRMLEQKRVFWLSGRRMAKDRSKIPTLTRFGGRRSAATATTSRRSS